MSDRPTHPPAEPGTLTSLVDEVFRQTPADARDAWVEGLAPGAAVGRYDLIREIGRGGFGVVWEARDRELGRRVAVKLIRAHREPVPERRALAEAEVAARLSHPGIVTVLDVGRNERGAWIVMEFLSGRTLGARLAEGPVPLSEAVRIALEVARALAHAHVNGVVHRDLTARNVFLCADGHVKLLDLGLAQAFGRRRPEGGTQEYMAPEQARGAPQDERVDVYALGVLLYRMVAGSLPFDGNVPPEERRPHRLETPDLPALGELVDRMLSSEPMERPRDAVAVAAELEALRDLLPRTGTGSGTAGGRVRVRRRWPRWTAGAAAVGLLGAAAAGGAIAARRLAPAPHPSRTPVAFGAVPSSVTCSWGKATWYELDRRHEGAVTRNGEIGGQGVADVEGRKAWRITSDWGQLFLPMGVAAEGDPFAVEVEFFWPPVTGWQRGATLVAFAAPVGGATSGLIGHGIGVSVVEEPGKPTWYTLLGFDATEDGLFAHRGLLGGPLAGRWHALRIEGSRAKGWYRALLDGTPIAMATGDVDVAGSQIVVTAGYGFMNPEDVAFSNLRTFRGTPECQ